MKKRFKALAYLPDISYEQDIANCYTDSSLIVPPTFSWRNMYISVTGIKDLEQYDKTSILITFYNDYLPILVKGVLEDINKQIEDIEVNLNDS